MKRSLLLILAAGLMSWVSLGANSVGTITYFEGDLSIRRNGAVIPAARIDFGFAVEDLDVIVTGRGSNAEITLDARTGVSAVLKVNPATRFTLNLSALRTEQTATVDLASGSIGLKVARLSGASGLNVRTGNAVMGVRGTEFRVVTAVNEDVLVTTTEGSVEVTDSRGRSQFSRPGTIVEALVSGLQSRAVTAAALQAFETQWGGERVQAFKADLPRAIRDFGGRYEQHYAQFQRAFQRLQAQQAILTKWAEEDRRGTLGGRADQLREKRSLIGPLLGLRQSTFFLERLIPRLLETAEYASETNLTGLYKPGVTYQAFFMELNRNWLNLDAQIAQVNHAWKMYARRNDGVLPVDDTASSGIGGSSGFFD